MKANQGLISRFSVGRGEAGMPLPAIMGPLIGLAYILVLPFVGVATLVLSSCYRGRQGLVTMWHKANQAVVETEKEAGAKAVSVNDLVRLFIDPLDCEFVVIDREFHITQYCTPPSRRNALAEQTVIGRHCFEVSHGRNSPCESCEHECPVSRVLQTNQEVTVTHYHKSQIKGRQRLVRILALPIRDNQGNITRVAELIWDAQRVK